MNTGTISIALDGEYIGVAFEDPQLKKGTFIIQFYSIFL
jgi:hypothetical protein